LFFFFFFFFFFAIGQNDAATNEDLHESNVLEEIEAVVRPPDDSDFSSSESDNGEGSDSD